MKVTLHLNGSAAAICAFLATVPEALVAGGAGPFVQTAPDAGTAMIQDGFTAIPNLALAVTPMPDLSGQDDGDDEGDDNVATAIPPAVDSAGLPWDKRIHATTKGINESDGTWRKKRNVSEATVASVEEELRNALPKPSAGILVPAPAPIVNVPMMPGLMPLTTPAPPLPEMPMMIPPVAAPTVPVAAPTFTPVAAPAAVAPAAEGIDFTTFMSHLTVKMQNQTVISDDLIGLVNQINAAFAPHGHAPLGSITDLQTDAVKLTYAVQLLQHNGKW